EDAGSLAPGWLVLDRGPTTQGDTNDSTCRMTDLFPWRAHVHADKQFATVRRLTRLEQLTLNTWRWAAATVQSTLDPSDILELAALHAVRGVLRDVNDPVALFCTPLPGTARVPTGAFGSARRLSPRSAARRVG